MSDFKCQEQLINKVFDVTINGNQMPSQQVLTSMEDNGAKDMYWNMALEKLKTSEVFTKNKGTGERAKNEFELYIKPLVLISSGNGEIILQCPSTFHEAWLGQQGYKEYIAQALFESGFPRDWDIIYSIEKSSSPESPTEKQENQVANTGIVLGKSEKASSKDIIDLIDDLKSLCIKTGEGIMRLIRVRSMSLVALMGGISLHDREEVKKNFQGLVELIEQKGSTGAIEYFLEYRQQISGLTSEINAKKSEEDDEKDKEEEKTIKQPTKRIVSKKPTLCAYSTDLSRVSPFFPLSKEELGKRKFMAGELINSGPWGEARQWGPQLCITEEDHLISISSFLQEKNNSHVEISYIIEEFLQEESIMRIYDEIYFNEHRNDESLISRFKKTLTYKGPLRPIIQRIMNSQVNPSKEQYDRAIFSMKLLSVTGLELSISTGKGKPRRHNKIRTILTNFSWDDDDNSVGNRLTVTIDPFFYLAFIHRREHILINVSERMRLSSPISKGLHRFATSHRTGYEGPYKNVANAININANLPEKERRRLLRDSCDDLIHHGILTSDSGLPRRSDRITLRRVK